MPKIDKQTAIIQQKVSMANQTTPTTAATTAATATTTTTTTTTPAPAATSSSSSSSSPVSTTLTSSASSSMPVDPNTTSPVKIRKKPGRKPNPASPALRKAQNRTAQRAFRERKERHLHELEETIKQLRMERDTRYIEVDKENLALKEMLEHMSRNNSDLMAMVMRLQGCLRNNDIPLPIFHRDLGEAIVVSEEDDINDDRVTIKQDVRNPLGMIMNEVNAANAAAVAAAAAAATPIIQNAPRAASTSFEHILRSSYASPPQQFMTPKESNSGYMLADHMNASYAGEEAFDEDFILEEDSLYGLPQQPHPESYGSQLQPHMGGNYAPVQIRFHPSSMDKQQQIALEEGGVIQNGGGQFIHMQIRLH